MRKDWERKGIILEGFSLLDVQSCLFFRQHRCYYLIYARLIDSAVLLPFLEHYILELPDAMQFGIKLFLMFIVYLLVFLFLKLLVFVFQTFVFITLENPDR